MEIVKINSVYDWVSKLVSVKRRLQTGGKMQTKGKIKY